ncbi:hypothetical protein GGR56DRAFT_260834 [Xylariaceae sp. FL0804]|nr:hypothetical protein GGR56DRAFT_260834 [Xylariaceae sp. FL0804]
MAEAADDGDWWRRWLPGSQQADSLTPWASPKVTRRDRHAGQTDRHLSDPAWCARFPSRRKREGQEGRKERKRKGGKETKRGQSQQTSGGTDRKVFVRIQSPAYLFGGLGVRLQRVTYLTASTSDQARDKHPIINRNRLAGAEPHGSSPFSPFPVSNNIFPLPYAGVTHAYPYVSHSCRGVPAWARRRTTNHGDTSPTSLEIHSQESQCDLPFSHQPAVCCMTNTSASAASQLAFPCPIPSRPPSRVTRNRSRGTPTGSIA